MGEKKLSGDFLKKKNSGKLSFFQQIVRDVKFTKSLKAAIKFSSECKIFFIYYSLCTKSIKLYQHSQYCFCIQFFT